jgi:hypothetical protein
MEFHILISTASIGNSFKLRDVSDVLGKGIELLADSSTLVWLKGNQEFFKLKHPCGLPRDHKTPKIQYVDGGEPLN